MGRWLPPRIKEEELAKGEGGWGGSKNIWRRVSSDNLIDKIFICEKLLKKRVNKQTNDLIGKLEGIAGVLLGFGANGWATHSQAIGLLRK